MHFFNISAETVDVQKKINFCVNIWYLIIKYIFYFIVKVRYLKIKVVFDNVRHLVDTVSPL